MGIFYELRIHKESKADPERALIYERGRIHTTLKHYFSEYLLDIDDTFTFEALPAVLGLTLEVLEDDFSKDYCYEQESEGVVKVRLRPIS